MRTSALEQLPEKGTVFIQKKGSERRDPMSNDENKSVILGWFNAVNKGDIPLLDKLAEELFTADFIEHDPRMLDFGHGSAAVKQTDHQHNAMMPYFTPVNDKHQLADVGQPNQQFPDEGQVISFTVNPVVLDPATVALDPAVRFRLIRGFAGNRGQLATFPSTMPLTSAARVVNLRAWLPFGSVGNNCRMLVVMVRYTRRLSLMGPLLFFLGGKKHSVPDVAVVICQSVRYSI
jgi:hypothetical protein